MKKRFYYLGLSFSISALLISACNNSNNKQKEYIDIIFKNYDSSILYESSIEKGSNAIYKGDTPIKKYDPQYHYSFKGWDKSLFNIEKDTTFIAQFDATPHVYTSSTISPSLGKEGYTKYECECGYSYIDNYLDSYAISMDTPIGEKEVISSSEYKEIMKITNDGWRNDIYSKMVDALFDYEYEYENSLLNKSSTQVEDKSSIKNKAKEQILALKTEANETAKINETSFDYEWYKTLNEYHCSNEQQLEDLLISQYKRKAILNWYATTNFDSLLEEYILRYQPYHTKHKMVKIDHSGTDDYGSYDNGLVSLTEVNTFMGMVNNFIIGEPFSSCYSDDSYSKNGDVEIMSTKTSFINPYKMGVYSFDGIFTPHNDEEEALRSAIGFSNNVNESEYYPIHQNIKDIGLKYVPFGALEKMYDVKNIEEVKEWEKDYPYRETYYFPRNIYFNKYFNRRNPFVLTNNSFDSSSSIHLDITGDNIIPNEIDISINAASEGKSGFRYVEGISKDPSQMILTDEKARPIMFVRSEYGIHLVVIEKSPFDENVKDYYTIDKNYEGDSFIKFDNPSTQYEIDERINTILNELENCSNSPYFDYLLFVYFLNNEEDISFNFIDSSIDFMSEIKYMIEEGIFYQNQRDDNLLFYEYGWRPYLNFINNQERKRKEGILIPEPIE